MFKKLLLWLWIGLMVFGFILFIFTAIVDLALGCPPPPFAHRCLMKQAGVLPPYNKLDNN